MSQKNREGKRSARERLREQRERDKAAQKRHRVLKVAGAMVAVLAVAAGIGAAVVGGGGDEGEEAAAEPITQGKGRAPATLTVYEDFRCPACKQFEDLFRDTVHELQDAGKLRTEYHIVTIIDGNMGGNGSKYAANAAACARDQGKFGAYHDVLFRNQPEEQDDAFGDEARLIELAGKVDGLRGTAFEDCVRSGEHADWVERSNSAFLESGHNATPTVLLDGEDVFSDRTDPLTPQKLRRLVAEKAG